MGLSVVATALTSIPANAVVTLPTLGISQKSVKAIAAKWDSGVTWRPAIGGQGITGSVGKGRHILIATLLGASGDLDTVTLEFGTTEASQADISTADSLVEGFAQSIAGSAAAIWIRSYLKSKGYVKHPVEQKEIQRVEMSISYSASDVGDSIGISAQKFPS